MGIVVVVWEERDEYIKEMWELELKLVEKSLLLI